MAFEFQKQPWEEEIVAVDFSRRVPSGVTIEPVATDVTDIVLEETVPLTGLIASNYSPHISIGTPSLTGVSGRERILAATISDGVADFKYRLSYRVTLSDGQKKEDDVWIIVKET